MVEMSKLLVSDAMTEVRILILSFYMWVFNDLSFHLFTKKYTNYYVNLKIQGYLLLPSSQINKNHDILTSTIFATFPLKKFHSAPTKCTAPKLKLYLVSEKK
jgi:hypothetical protein